MIKKLIKNKRIRNRKWKIKKIKFGIKNIL